MPNQSDIKAITTLTKEQIQLFMAWAMVIREGKTYYHLPQWYKDLGNGEFEVLNFEELPTDVKIAYINSLPKAVTPLDNGNYVDLGLIRTEIMRIKALGLTTDGLLQMLVNTIKNENSVVENI